jgi:cation:H+ antiporter
MLFESSVLNGITTIVAIALLIGSSEKVVDKLVLLANAFGVSKTFAGLTVMSLATSLPEIGSHLVASLGIITKSLHYQVASATVLGANIGSDVFQQTFALGLVVLFMGELVFEKTFLLHAYLPMICTTLLCIILGWDGTYSRVDGLILFSTFLAYTFFLYKQETINHVMDLSSDKSQKVMRDVLLLMTGMAILLVSAYVLLRQLEGVVKVTGLGGSFLGVITLGLASAAPEMLTAIQGIRKQATGISLGTLIGSNIVNPLVAIGLGSMASTYWVPKPLVLWDLPMETITAAILLSYLLLNKRTLGKWGGLYLIFLYAAYLSIRAFYFNTD